MTKDQNQRLQLIMRIAEKLCWLYPNNQVPGGYPFMQASDVEKCLLMMVDDFEFDRFMKAAKSDAVVAINQEENPSWAKIP